MASNPPRPSADAHQAAMQALTAELEQCEAARTKAQRSNQHCQETFRECKVRGQSCAHPNPGLPPTPLLRAGPTPPGWLTLPPPHHALPIPPPAPLLRPAWRWLRRN